jgi:hypothetical protein
VLVPRRQGFKAGNLNFALQEVAADYPFFAAVDADERLPVNSEVVIDVFSI